MAMDARDSTDTAGQMPVVGGRSRDRRTVSRLGAALRLSALFMLVLATLFAGGFGWFANKVSHLTTPANPARADAIIVLTGGQSRLDAAMDLLASGKGARLLI
ncbi:MAG: YdcF family protein, partial [Mesorhizobium sp.]